MKKELNLVEILKDCPKGMKLWSPCWGELTYKGINWKEYEAWDFESDDVYPIIMTWADDLSFNPFGKYIEDGDVMIYPSKDNRDWSTFKAPPKPKWNPDTLQPFDKVLGIRAGGEIWQGDMFLYRDSIYNGLGGKEYDKMIPYNEETKHLLGTNQEAPEYYRL